MKTFWQHQSWISYTIVFSLTLFLLACRSEWQALYAPSDRQLPVYRVMASPAPSTGEPEAGYRYLTTGGYVGSGFPWSFVNADSSRRDTILNRDGQNARVSWTSIAFQANNGATVVSGSCFSCHGSLFRGEPQLAIGNSLSDFTNVKPWQQPFFPWLVRRKAGKDSDEWAAAEQFVAWLTHSFPWIKTEQIGLNPAFRLEEAFAAHRDPTTLAYREQPVFPRRGPNVASDVPPLWNVKKKSALYYNGMGRGDFTKLLMQAGMMGIPDTNAAREIQQQFVDVVAWLESLEPPQYPGDIDPGLAAEGALIFEENCQKCHGSYGEFPEYPNRIVPLDEIGTDPAYARYFVEQSGLPDWYNQSWFATSSPASRLQPSAGYMAPPLDGVWATAPYLHNGSVPTLRDLLDSSRRPAVWSRPNSLDTYDLEQVGWPYHRDKAQDDEVTYDTRLPGQSNQGHTFGDELSASQRNALIEYLKTL